MSIYHKAHNDSIKFRIRQTQTGVRHAHVPGCSTRGSADRGRSFTSSTRLCWASGLGGSTGKCFFLASAGLHFSEKRSLRENGKLNSRDSRAVTSGDFCDMYSSLLSISRTNSDMHTFVYSIYWNRGAHSAPPYDILYPILQIVRSVVVSYLESAIFKSSYLGVSS